MSDNYSVPSFSQKQGEATATWVNANTVLQSLIQNLGAEDRKAIVLRCDELPLLPGSQEEMETVFSNLLQTILQKKTSVTQLFLHINCKKILPDAVIPFGQTQYMIQFHTNILPSADWKRLYTGQLTTITAIIQKHKGSLLVAEAPGCLFSLSLPGKSL